MVARALVEKNIEQGARLLRALDEAGIPVDVAYWMLASEWSHWWLVLGTPRGDETGPDRVSLQDSYVYRLMPSRKHAANGTARKRRTPRTGAATQGRSRMTSDAPQTPSPTPG